MDADKSSSSVGPAAAAVCNVRHVVQAAVSPSILDILREIGFGLEFEFVTKGFTFSRNGVRITLSKLFR